MSLAGLVAGIIVGIVVGAATYSVAAGGIIGLSLFLLWDDDDENESHL